jgi:hypothetical protein
MERPNTILGLTSHLVRQRWSALGRRSRIALLALGALGAVAGVKLAVCGSACGAACPSHVAAHAAAEAGSDCPHARSH